MIEGLKAVVKQWEALEELRDLAKESMTPEEVDRVTTPMRESAREALRLLERQEDSEGSEDTPASKLKQKLLKIASGE